MMHLFVVFVLIKDGESGLLTMGSVVDQENDDSEASVTFGSHSQNIALSFSMTYDEKDLQGAKCRALQAGKNW